ncbi:hypothetical protein [uncultured Flavobacterium sp.]|uniref:hypothetical protein n=1 Tax=uncultured Flavobacterium sp. TaxID=165435 RepID=UPI0030EDA5D3|tara:strand:- start:128181 stop:128624 length:444 start_codon:yes stop_codon:yes gene_type:complete
MKKSIFTIAILALSFLNVNATEVTTTSNNLEITTSISRENIVEVYDWSVKTTNGNYAGTSNSLEEAQKMILLVSAGEVVLDKKIETFFQLRDEVSNSNLRLFFWEVETTNGKAKGFSSSENQAKRMIELVSTGDVLNFKIIIAAEYK